MTFESIISNTIIPFIVDHFYLTALIGSILSGNIFVLFLSTLAGQGTLVLWKVWIMALIGTFTADLIWFNLGKTEFVNRIVRHRIMLYNFYSIKNVLDKSGEKNNFLVFIASRFIFGTRILTLMYAGRRNMHEEDFIKYDFRSSAIWVTILVFLGFLAGKGFNLLITIFNNLKTATLVFLVIFIILYTLWYLSGRVFINKIRNITNRISVPKINYPWSLR